MDMKKHKKIQITYFLIVLLISLSLTFVSAAEKSSDSTEGFFGKFINWIKNIFLKTDNITINQTNDNQTKVITLNDTKTIPKVKEYKDKISFYNFTDPNEKAFTINLPKGWQVSKESGLVRPYIDAGVMLQVSSQKNQGFFYISPYGVYTVPNALLDFAGFTEGKYYDPSGGISTPMIVKKYTEAEDYLNEYVEQLNVETKIIEIIDRPDLIKSEPGPLITKQSAAEMTYISNPGQNQLKNKVVVYIYLVETGSTGIWASSLFGYYSPEELFNETEYLVLKSEETFKVDSNWAKREAEEVNKRIGIISSTQDSISETISSTFEYKSKSMDDINDKWSKTILGIEEVYDPDTEEMHVVDSGSKYYWIDNRNNIYGTDTYENPFPQEDVRLMNCPDCSD